MRLLTPRPRPRLAALLLLVATAPAPSCGGGGATSPAPGPGPAPNAAPAFVAGALLDRALPYVDGAVEVALVGTAQDPEDGTDLEFTLVPPAEDPAADAEVDPVTRVLTLTPRGLGERLVGLRVIDSAGAEALAEFRVTVTGTPSTVSLEVVADATIYAGGDAANGAGQYVFAGTNAGSVPIPRRALFRFDVSGLDPATLVVDARIVLRVSRSPQGAPPTQMTVHRLLRAFGEGPTDPGGNEGGGGPPAVGDATWVHAVHATEPWTAPGGDFEPAPSAGASIADVEQHQSIGGPGLAADVEAWRDGAANAGWILLGDETRTQSVKRFESRASPFASDRPTLVLDLIGPP